MTESIPFKVCIPKLKREDENEKPRDESCLKPEQKRVGKR